MANSDKRILIATGIFPPQVGGPATYSKLLSEELPKRGFDVKVVNFGEVLKYPKILRHILYFYKVLFASFDRDVIYAQDPVSVGLPALLAATLIKKKFYLKIVGDYAWEQGSQRAGVTDLLDEFSAKNEGYPFMVRMMKKVETMVAKLSDKIIVPSKYLKKIVSNWGVNPEKITAIYNAFDAPKINESREELRKALGWEGRIIISAGRLVPWKGFDTLISLMPEIKAELPDAELYIAGDGPDRPRLDAKVKNAGAKDMVTLLGKVRQEELFRMILAADLFALNTSYEGLSHQLLEVMALGTPIVTTNAGGNVETIENGINGELVTYNDRVALRGSIISILTNEAKAERYKKNAKKKLDFFGEERMLEEISAFLKA